MRASLASHYDSQSASGLVTRSPNPNSHIVGLDIGTRGLRAVTARLGLHDDSGAVSSPESSSPPEAPAVSLPLRLSAPDAPAQAAVVDVDSDVEFHPLAVHRVENPNGGLEARPLDPFAGWPGLTLADGSVIANPNVLVGGLAAMGTHPPSPTPAEQSPVFSLPVPPVGLTEPTLSFGADSGYFSAAWEEMGLGGEDGNEGGNGAGTGDDGLQFFNESWE